MMSPTCEFRWVRTLMPNGEYFQVLQQKWLSDTNDEPQCEPQWRDVPIWQGIYQPPIA